MSGVNAVDVSSASRVAQSLGQPVATAKATSASSSAAATANSEGISSSDFLTLLVTEMKNQDPTQPTDPNAYIQQLVGVNSLQQLISINQELGSATGGTTTATATGGSVVSGVNNT